MERDPNTNIVGVQEVLHDYTTAYCHLTLMGSGGELGTGLLKFRTFEDPGAVASFAQFLASFQVTGTDDPRLKAQGQLRFLAFTNQFVIREYEPFNPMGSFILICRNKYLSDISLVM